LKFNIHTSKRQVKVDTPGCWAKTTTAQYERLISEWDEKDLVQAFSILTGIDAKTISNMVDPEIEDWLFVATDYLFREPQYFKELPLPETVTLRGKEIKIPKRVEGFTIGQSIQVRQKLDTVKMYEEAISYAVAVYLQPKVDGGDFDDDKALELLVEIKKIPITVTYPIGFFLLRKLMRHGGIGWNFARHIRHLLRRVWWRSASSLLWLLRLTI
jgi:hypothetical protein